MKKIGRFLLRFVAIFALVFTLLSVINTGTIYAYECGDGTVDAGEECDDGNNVDGDGCLSTCKAEPPPCLPLEASCSLNTECCSGVCTGKKCKVSHPPCKGAGMPCGGNNECCNPLICRDSLSNEPDKCGPPCPSIGTCLNNCGYPGGDQVPDGNCGFIICPATSPCEGECPNYCGYEGGLESDGAGGLKWCPPIAACPPDLPKTGSGFMDIGIQSAIWGLAGATITLLIPEKKKKI